MSTSTERAQAAFPDPIDWKVAAKVAARLGGSEPFDRSYHAPSLVADFAELTPLAEVLVTAHTGLHPDGPARARVVSRADWVNTNIRSFQRMLRPLTQHLAAEPQSAWAPASRVAAGVEVGTILGMLSRRVLGQYDLLGAGDEQRPQDEVVYVGPNVLALEKRFAFPPREFRLWLALHEVTHRAQFTGVAWMRAYFLGLTEQSLGSAEPNPAQLLIALRRVVAALRDKRNPFDEGGIVALLAGDQQLAALNKMGGLMSLLEGHGDITMDRAGVELVPSAPRFSATLRQRRSAANPAMRLFQQAAGFEAKLRQYAEGEQFIEAVERSRGIRFVDHAWTSPDHLPTLAEIRQPDAWIQRVDGLVISAATLAPSEPGLARSASTATRALFRRRPTPSVHR